MYKTQKVKFLLLTQQGNKIVKAFFSSVLELCWSACSKAVIRKCYLVSLSERKKFSDQRALNLLFPIVTQIKGRRGENRVSYLFFHNFFPVIEQIRSWKNLHTYIDVFFFQFYQLFFLFCHQNESKICEFFGYNCSFFKNAALPRY